MPLGCLFIGMCNLAEPRFGKADSRYKRHYRESGVPDASSYAVGRRVASVERPFSGGSTGTAPGGGSRRSDWGTAPSSAAGAPGEARLRPLGRGATQAAASNSSWRSRRDGACVGT